MCAPAFGSALSPVRVDMITPLQQPSIHTAVRAPANTPYAGPERRVADRRRSDLAGDTTFGFDTLGPYLPDRLRVVRQHLAQLTSIVAVDPIDPHDVDVGAVGAVEANGASMDAAPDAIFEAADAGLAPSSASLPWITSFLDDEGAEEPALHDERDVETMDDAPEWSIEAAASELRRLAMSFGASDYATPTGVDAAGPDAAVVDDPRCLRVQPLAMWSDEDFLHVLPAHLRVLPIGAPITSETENDAEADIWDDTPSFRTANEAVASALESVAQRVRAGELSLGGFDTAHGEAAALASTLAALLSSRS